MARRNSTQNTEAVEAEAPEVEVNEAEVNEAEVNEAVEAEKPAAEKPAEADLTAFTEALAVTHEQRDETTGTLPEAAFTGVVQEYRKLPGRGPKQAAKNLVDEAMKNAMDGGDLAAARAYLEISNNLTAGSVSSGAPRRTAAPVDPTEAFVDLVSGLVLAATLAQAEVPEGVDEAWAEKVTEKVGNADEAVQAYRTWLTSDAEDKGEAPETPAFVQAAVKLSLGKSAKVGGGAKKASNPSNYEGDRRDVAVHIQSAFEEVEEGTFLTIAEIRKHKSAEYGEDAPSAGAISARLFPRSGKSTVKGIKPGTNDKGVKGALKVADDEADEA